MKHELLSIRVEAFRLALEEEKGPHAPIYYYPANIPNAGTMTSEEITEAFLSSGSSGSVLMSSPKTTEQRAEEIFNWLIK